MSAPALDLTVIIVNYNVRYFLEQCLISVFQAADGLAAEVIVVDNASQDDSLAMLRARFGNQVTVIANTHNSGFSAANNQGIAHAKGRHILLLNPDTLVPADAFVQCIAFMDAHPDAGALGVYMVDGSGRFLPESKRALPTPWVSFYKIFGLAGLFPRHPRFGRYHLGHLDRNQTHSVDVLSGAFMWFRAETLEAIGGLDEAFFMYGEDIDISWRVVLSGRRNYYFPGVKILHYKGESTRKGSLNYVRVFYQAMILFARKHFGGAYQQMFIGAIRLAVYSRALVAALERVVWKAGFSILEGGLIYAAMYGIKAYWEHYIKFIEGGYYPPMFAQAYMPAYTVVFVGLLWAFGAYRRPYRLRPLVLAPVMGFALIATVTYTFGAVLNFSRAIVGLSAIFTGIIAFGLRAAAHWRERGHFFFTDSKQQRAVVLGDQGSAGRVAEILRSQHAVEATVIGLAGKQTSGPWPWLGSADAVPGIMLACDADDLIVDLEATPVHDLIRILESAYPLRAGVKTLPPQSNFLAGPNLVIVPGYGGGGGAFRLADPRRRREKRLFDLAAAVLLLLAWPIAWPWLRAPRSALKRLLLLLAGSRTVVGYQGLPHSDLPALPPALLTPLVRAGQWAEGLSPDALNIDYAQRYSWELDLACMLKGWRLI